MPRPDWMLDGKMFCEECGCRHDLDGCGKPECKHCYAQTVKVVINTCFGGFGLNSLGEEEYRKRTGIAYQTAEWEALNSKTYGTGWKDAAEDLRYEYSFRVDPTLVAMVEEDSKLYSGRSADLRVVEVPADVDWEIKDYDGQEHVAEKHRTWS